MRYLILPEELSDGCSRCVISEDEWPTILVDSLRAWLETAEPGEEVKIGWTEMEPEAFAELEQL